MSVSEGGGAHLILELFTIFLTLDLLYKYIRIDSIIVCSST